MKRIAWVTAIIVFVCGSVWSGGFDVELLPLDSLSIDLHLRPGSMRLRHTGDDTFKATATIIADYHQQRQEFDFRSYTRLGLDFDYDESEHSSFFSADIIKKIDAYQYLSGNYFFGSSPFSPRVGMVGWFNYISTDDPSFSINADPFFGVGRLLDASHYVRTYLAVKGLGVEYLARSSYTRIAGFSAQRSSFRKPFDWAEDLEAYRLIDHSVPGMFDSIHVKYMLDNVVRTSGLSSGFRIGLYPRFWFDNKNSTSNVRAEMVYLDAVISGPFSPVLWYKGSLKLYDHSLRYIDGNSFSDVISGISDNWVDLDNININTAFDLSWFPSQRFRVDYGLGLWLNDIFNNGFTSSYWINNQIRADYRFASHTSGYAIAGLSSNQNRILEDFYAEWGLSFKIL